MKEAEILDFVRTSIGSVWALEVLVLVRGQPERAWQTEALVRELRSSPAAIEGAAELLQGAGLVARAGDQGIQYKPATETLDKVGELVEKIYMAKPATVIGAIFESSSQKLRTFAAAFRFKE